MSTGKQVTEITDSQVQKALEQYCRVSLEQALWVVFGETDFRDTAIAREALEGSMRTALERVAAARAQRAEQNPVTSIAREAAIQYGRDSGRGWAATAKELDAMEDVVRLVLGKARVAL